MMAVIDDIPKYAFGTAIELGDNKEKGQMTESELKEFILEAIRLGCRHFDCAPLYKNQHVVGQAIKEAIKTNLVPRQHLFITSKLPPNMMRPDHVQRSIENTLKELQLTYLDLFLIHAPFSTQHLTDDDVYPTDEKGNLLLDEEKGLLESTWLQMVDLKRKGFTRYVGVSNVSLEQVVRLNKLFQIDVVQNEYHIYNSNREIFDYCEETDVHYEAYAVFGSPTRAIRENKSCFFNDPTVRRVAYENQLTIAQLVIEWIHNQPLSYVVKCDSVEQLEENLLATRYQTMSIDDLIDLDSLNKNVRVYLFDEHKGVSLHREYPFKKQANYYYIGKDY